MKVGFVVDYFDFRSDIRKIIGQIGRTHQVVLFCRQSDEATLRKYAGAGVEVRIIREEKKSAANSLWKLLFVLFGKIPKSRRNFYLTELFRLNREENKVRKLKGRLLLELRRILPDWLGYDDFLGKIRYSGATAIGDIDRFFLFTDIYDHFLFARLLDEGKPLAVYVYSWDHPCKFLRFSRRADYLVWGEKIREDLYQLQGIPPQRVKVAGATQFTYVAEFKRLDPAGLTRPYDFEYLYFACSVATPRLLAEEVAVIKELSGQLARLEPAVKLVVRPYPVLGNWQYYEPLRALPNVVFDDGYRSRDKSIKENAIGEKYEKIHFARGFFHMGTTLGLEACFTDTPSFIINFRRLREQGGYVSMYHFVHQYQNEKYLLLDGFANVIGDAGELETVITGLGRHRPRYLDYNRAVVRNFNLHTIEELADHFLER
jgi:hypothetical protein